MTLFDPVVWTVAGSRAGTLIVFPPDVPCSLSVAPTDPDASSSVGCALPGLGVYPYKVARFGAGSGKVVVVPPLLSALSSRVVFGGSVDLFGELPTPEAARDCPTYYGILWPAPFPVRDVTIYARRYGERAFRPIATAQALGLHGYLAAVVSPAIRTTYEARIGDEATTMTTVQVRPRIDIRARGRWLVAHAEAAHSLAGARVEVQARGRGGWRTMRRLELDSTGSVAFRSPDGARRIRIFMSARQAGPGYVAGFSRAVRL